MKQHTKRASRKGALCFALLSALLCFFLFSFLSALLLFLTKNPTAHIPLAALLSLGLSGTVAALLTAKRCEGGAAHAVIASLLLLFSLLAVGTLLASSAPSGRVWMNALCYLLATLLGILLSTVHLGGKRKKHRRRR